MSHTHRCWTCGGDYPCICEKPERSKPVYCTPCDAAGDGEWKAAARRATQDLGVGSHVPVLAAAVAKTTGPVLECGTGWWSTPLLHLMCKDRPLVSLETDREWVEKFGQMRSPMHDLRHVSDWKAVDLIDSVEWSVAFVDNSPGEERIDVIRRLRSKTTFIVAHDTDADIPPSGGNYGWAKINGVFRFQFTYMIVRPWTTVYSDFKEFAL